MTDLSVILSAEHYDDGVLFQAPRPRDTSSRRASDVMDDAQHGKRASAEEVEAELEHGGGGAGAGGGAGRKRARGRPRVEPKDDTAADVSFASACSKRAPPQRCVPCL